MKIYNEYSHKKNSNIIHKNNTVTFLAKSCLSLEKIVRHIICSCQNNNVILDTINNNHKCIYKHNHDDYNYNYNCNHGWHYTMSKVNIKDDFNQKIISYYFNFINKNNNDSINLNVMLDDY